MRDADLLKDVEGIEVTLTEMTPFQMLSAFDQPQDTSDSTDAAEGTNVGKLKQQELTEKPIHRISSANTI